MTVDNLTKNTQVLSPTKTPLLLIVTVLFALSLFFTQSNTPKQYYDETAKNALIAFATARAINAIISVIQETEISVTPAGVGVNTSPGEILDPLNDMVERFSWVMLASSIALKIQGYLMEILEPKIVSFLLVTLFVSALLSIIFLKTPNIFKVLIIKTFLLFALLNILTPSTALLSHFLKNGVLQAEYDKSTKVLESANSKLKQYDAIDKEVVVDIENNKPKIEGFLDGIKNSIDQLYSNLENSYKTISIEDKINELKNDIEHWIEGMVELAAQFIFLTILMPLLMLWILYQSNKYIVKKEIL